MRMNQDKTAYDEKLKAEERLSKMSEKDAAKERERMANLAKLQASNGKNDTGPSLYEQQLTQTSVDAGLTEADKKRDFGVKEGTSDSWDDSNTAPQVEKKDKKDLPKAASGGLFNGPREGYNVILHGNEMVIPMDKMDKVSKQELPQSIVSDQMKAMSGMVDNKSSGAIITVADQSKILVQEMQALNKHTGEMLRYMKETADHAKQNVNATKALHGNLFPN